MNNNLKELIADIDHIEHVSRQNTIDAILSVEQKNDDIKYYNKKHSIPKRESSIPGFCSIDNSLPENRSYADYDFKGHDSRQGRVNRDIVKLIMDLEGCSDRYHCKITNRTAQLLTGGTSRKEANNVKYIKTKELIEMMNKKDLPNFIKMTFVPGNVGKLNGRKAFVFFVEFDLPEGRYMISWHLERNKKPISKNVCEWISKCCYNNDRLVKYGNKHKEAYEEKEKEYAIYSQNKHAGDPALNALCMAFDFK